MATYIDNLDQAKVEIVLADLREKRPDYIKSAGDGDERFALWMMLVDRWLLKRYEITHADLSDFNWRPAYDGEQSPGEAAQEAIESDDLYSMFFDGE